MTRPHEKLAESLEILEELQDRGGLAVRSADLSRTHRERLVKNGFLLKVMNGWYIPVSPAQVRGESTPWFASFWDFCAEYLTARFGKNWSLSPEQSLLLHVGNKAGMIQKTANLHLGDPDFSSAKIARIFNFYETEEGFIVPGSYLDSLEHTGDDNGIKPTPLMNSPGPPKQRTPKPNKKKSSPAEKKKTADDRQLKLFDDEP